MFRQRLEQLQQECGLVREVRVRGVMIGIELSIEGAATVQGCLERQLLVNCTHGTVIRLLPAMNLTEQQAHEGCDILAEVLKKQAGNICRCSKEGIDGIGRRLIDNMDESRTLMLNADRAQERHDATPAYAWPT